jgi:RNA polymerase sigma-70 factor (ECF subfamily)
MTETDARLVARTRAGDRVAAGLLAERYLRACRAVALAILGELADAEDVCQDAFVVAMERIDDCRDPERFSAWLFQIVRNRARDHHRARNARGMTGLGTEAVESDSSTNPARTAELSDLRGRLIKALFELPEERREIVLLHDLEGWTHREIAERMGLPQGTVRSHLHHARARLRTLLSPLQE